MTPYGTNVSWGLHLQIVDVRQGMRYGYPWHVRFCDSKFVRTGNQIMEPLMWSSARSVDDRQVTESSKKKVKMSMVIDQ